MTVFFRLLLAIPHFIWIGLFGIAVSVVVFINWWATLFAGRSPKGLHGFIAGYVRYVTQVEGYLYVAANPYPPFFVGDTTKSYPIDVEIDPPAPQNRAVTFFRLFLALPALLIASALGGFGSYSGYYRYSGAVGGTAAFLIWFAALVRGRAPRGLRDLCAWGIGYTAQLFGYLFILTDRYPTSDPLAHLRPTPAAAPAALAPDERLRALEALRAAEPLLSLEEALARLEPTRADEPPSVVEEAPPPMPARGVVSDDLHRSRLTVFFRLLLWVPHLVWWIFWSVLAWPAALLNWVCALVLGRAPRPLARFLSAYVRYGTHQSAFVQLIGGPFPGFVGKAGSYPIDLEIEPFERQRRVTILFRLVLVLPALLLTSAAGGVSTIAAFLGWFAALVRGRMPVGLRNAGAWAVTYSGQFFAYAFVLSDRYPYSSPLALSWNGHAASAASRGSGGPPGTSGLRGGDDHPPEGDGGHHAFDVEGEGPVGPRPADTSQDRQE